MTNETNQTAQEKHTILASSSEQRTSVRSPGADAVRPEPARNGSTADTTAILVLGMHRSGTSAIARVLGMMGAEIGEPDELLPAHPLDNPAGYWERAELNTIHDQLLATTGHAWNRLAGFDPHNLCTEAHQAFTQQLNQVVDKLNASGKPWVAKDPRMCLLLSRWQPLLKAPAYVVVVRDPREIAASMATGPRGTFTSLYVVALWKKYLRTLLMDLSGERVLFVSYAELLEDPQAQTTRLVHGLRELGVSGLHEPAAPELASFLDAKLRRSTPKSHVLLSPAQAALYQWLDAQCHADHSVTVPDFPQSAAPDAVLAEFQAAFDYHVEQGRAQMGGLIAELRLEQDRLVAELAVRHHELQQVRGQLAMTHEQVTQVRGQLTQTLEQAKKLSAQLAEVQHLHVAAASESARQAHELNLLRQHAAAIDGQVQALRSSWSWKITAPLRAVASLMQLRLNFNAEHHLYRLFYRVPGMDAARKRALIVRLHQHASWLTRYTLSYRLYEQTQQLLSQRATSAEERVRMQRMDEQRAAQVVAAIENPPLISIVMPVYNVERRWLLAAVDSVRRQFYPHWQLCIADDASTREETKQALEDVTQIGDERILLRRLPKNVGIAGASNAALEMANGDYVGLLDNDDALTRDALLEMAQRIIADDPDLLYSDEDKLDPDGHNAEPHFKPDFNLDYLFAINYVCHFSVLRRSLLQRIGGFREGYDGAQDYDLLLRATEVSDRVAHVQKILYHWRKTSDSTATASATKPKSWEAGRRALAESLARRGIDASAEPGPYPNTFRVRRTITGQPLVTIMIPFRDKPELLSTCIRSILDKTDYPHFEILGIDNGSGNDATHALMRKLESIDSRVHFIRYDAPFNYSAVNNFGARHATGEHLLLLNNDTEVIAPDWLRAMLEHSQRPEVGVVGAKLLYPDNTIQHAGVIVGIGGVAGHAHLLEPADRPGYFSRAQLTQALSAVTFACAMTRRAVFEQLGGLNEQDLTIAFNDVDYCLRAREAGYLVIYTPSALLFHYESRTRGYEDNPEKQARFSREIAYMQQRHAAILKSGDPHYNPYLSLINNFQPDPRYADELPL